MLRFETADLFLCPPKGVPYGVRLENNPLAETARSIEMEEAFAEHAHTGNRASEGEIRKNNLVREHLNAYFCITNPSGHTTHLSHIFFKVQL